jgi:hypothetical protein
MAIMSSLLLARNLLRSNPVWFLLLVVSTCKTCCS